MDIYMYIWIQLPLFYLFTHFSILELDGFVYIGNYNI